jgi:hypothetical protein
MGEEKKAPLPIAILADPGRRDHFAFRNWCAILWGMIGGALFRRNAARRKS